MTEEEVLQKVNDYCNEKSYTGSTLTDGFKTKFVSHFTKAYADSDINDENVLTNMKFALNTAWSSASEVITEKNKLFETKENDYKQQIQELTEKLDGNNDGNKVEIPKEIKEQLDELKKFKDEKSRQDLKKAIIKIAKTNIRQDLHSSFEEYTEDYNVKLDMDEKEQAASLVKRFQAIFKSSIGNITPLKPQQTQKQDEDFLASIPKVKIS